MEGIEAGHTRPRLAFSGGCHAARLFVRRAEPDGCVQGMRRARGDGGKAVAKGGGIARGGGAMAEGGGGGGDGGKGTGENKRERGGGRGWGEGE